MTHQPTKDNQCTPPKPSTEQLLLEILSLLLDVQYTQVQIKKEQYLMANRVEDVSTKILDEVAKANASLDKVKADEAELKKKIDELKAAVDASTSLSDEEKASLQAAVDAVAALAVKADSVDQDTPDGPVV